MQPDLEIYRDVKGIIEARELFNTARLTPETRPKSLNQHQRLTLILSFFVRDQSCMLPECMRACTDKNCKLRTCRGCYRIQYCSRRCQKRAWVHPLIPHRNSCTAIATVCHRLSMPPRRELFSKEYGVSVQTWTSTPLLEQLLDFVVEHLDRLGKLGHHTNTSQGSTHTRWYNGTE